MELTFACRSCGLTGRVPSIEAATECACASCGEARPVQGTVFGPDGLAGCPACGTEDLYVQKDFPQRLGMAILLASFGVSSVFWYYEMPLWTYAILLTSVLLDMWLYYHVPDVTICYRCLSQVRGVGSNPGGRYRPFDLAVGERYRQERIRVDEHRRRVSEAGSAGRGAPPVD